MKTKSTSAILLIHCDDQPGIVASVAQFIKEFEGNIIHVHEHVDYEDKIFFMRLEWELDNFKLERQSIGEVFGESVADKFAMNWKLYFSDKVPRVALFVSKLNHCLFDILANAYSGSWNIEIPLIVSNHEALKPIADKFEIDYQYLPITRENKKEQEDAQLKLLEEYKIDFIVLARYMQIISGKFIERYPNKIINIHHSFLPAFPGAKPYHSAHERGVKIIGATSHYVTEELDAGPIIEQDVVRVTHKDSVKDLVRKGRDLEKVVLSRGIWHHLNRRVLVYKNRTIVFD